MVGVSQLPRAQILISSVRQPHASTLTGFQFHVPLARLGSAQIPRVLLVARTVVTGAPVTALIPVRLT